MLLCVRERASQELALGAMEVQCEDELPPALPAILCQQVSPRDEIPKRRSVGRRCAGAPARCQVEFRELFALINRRDQAETSVELIDDLKDRFITLLRRRPRR